MPTSKPIYKCSQILPSSFHLKNPEYSGLVQIGDKFYKTSFFTSKEEAALELLCLEKKLSYELIETVEMEGVYPERATIMEERYQASGRTNGLYTGLIMCDGQVSSDTTN